MKEDFNIINSNNKVIDSLKYNQNYNTKGVGNPYPVFYKNGEPIYEGDKILVITKNSISYETITFTHRVFINRDPEYVKIFTEQYKLGWRK